MKLTNIRLQGNEHGKPTPDIVYADLVHDDGRIAISATLDYILTRIRDRSYQVEGVKVELKDERGAVCSFVRLTRYE